jgi:hypothetical protein
MTTEKIIKKTIAAQLVRIKVAYTYHKLMRRERNIPDGDE